jgi:hypothetical protein
VGEEKDLHENIRRAEDPQAPIDNTLTVLVARDAAGQSFATLTNWACHATTEDEANLRWSADWVADYRQALAAKLPGVHIFINGAIGGAIQPSPAWRDRVLGGEEQGRNFKWAAAFGRTLADKAAPLMAGAKPFAFDGIRVQRAPVRARVANQVYALAKSLRLLRMALPPLGEVYQTEVTAASLGPLRVGTLPGEVMPDLGMGARRQLGGEAQVLVGLGQDWLGYIVERKYHDDPRYAYERFLCLGPELGSGLAAAYRGLRFE